jgi:hypothetical protein
VSASGSNGPERGRGRRRSTKLSKSLKESSESLPDDDSSEVSKRCRSRSRARRRSRSRSRSRSREKDKNVLKRDKDVVERGYDTDDAVEFYQDTPAKDKPKISDPEGEKYRWGRYAADKAPAKRKPFAEWRKTAFNPAKKGGRPGRAGGPAQKGRRLKLEREEGFENVENVQLGDHFPDMRKEHDDGTTEYVEVGKMNLNGTPCAREANKLKEEIPHLDEGDQLTFVANDGRRVTYDAGDSPNVVDTTAAETITSAQRKKAEEGVAKEMDTT